MEVPADAAVREMWEETGAVVRLTRLVGVFGGPEFIVAYPNGDRTSYAMMVFEACIVGGELSPDRDETMDVRFFPPEALPGLEVPVWLDEIVRGLLSGDDGVFRPPTWSPPWLHRPPCTQGIVCGPAPGAG